MYEQIQINKFKPSGRNLVDRSRSRRGCVPAALALALAWIAVSPTARAVTPAPDGGYPNGNTAEGEDALFSLTSGINNTAIGFQALHDDTTGANNMANGVQALFSNTTGVNNTATGYQALFSNVRASDNTATGYKALRRNKTGVANTASGAFALFSNTAGGFNTANGLSSLASNTTGSNNTANGFDALFHNTIGGSNIGLGSSAGFNLTTGDNNIDIGNRGVAGEANTIRVGEVSTQKATFIAGISGVTVAGGVTVVVDPNGQLGTVTSSERFKAAIKPMDKASEAILGLKPVTFHYKHELDPKSIPQFGLLAEQVEKVNPDLVARDSEGKVYTVRYEAVNAMLLNEFLKEHRKVEAQEATITQLKEADATLQATAARQQLTNAEQQKEIKALTASLKAQAAQIQKVSDRLEVRSGALRLTANEDHH